MTRAGVTQRTSNSVVIGLVAAALLVALTAAPASSQSLRGSAASLDLQNRVAGEHDFTFIDTGRRVRIFASEGWLVRVRPGRDFQLYSVSFPYARPEVALFVERLAGQYRAALDTPHVRYSVCAEPEQRDNKSTGRHIERISIRPPSGRFARRTMEITHWAATAFLFQQRSRQYREDARKVGR